MTRPTEARAPLARIERLALHVFAWESGRNWKQLLRDEWMRACARLPEQHTELPGHEYRGTLQRLRNNPDFGSAGLGRFELPSRFQFKGDRR